MKWFLAISSLVLAVTGAVIYRYAADVSDSALHEIEALLYWLMAAVLFVGACVVEAIQSLQPQAPHANAAPAPQRTVPVPDPWKFSE